MSDKENAVVLTPAEISRALQKKDREDIIGDVRKVRESLEEFTLRDFSEAFLGEEYTDIVYGKEGGNVKMGELKLDMTPSGDGKASMRLNEAQIIGIMKQAHPSLSDADIRVMLTHQPEETKKLALAAMNQHESEVDESHERAHKAHDDIRYVDEK